MVKTIVQKIRKFSNEHDLIFSTVILLFIGIITYFKVPFLFFQQDEWSGLGLIQAYGYDLVLRRFEIGDLNHFVPLGNLISIILFKLFQLNYILYNLLALVIHLVNSILIYSIVKSILNRNLALLSAVLFLTSNLSSQLIMWPIVGVNILALSFSLLAVKLLLSNRNVNPLVLGIYLSSLLLLSLFIIEYSAGMIFFIPLLVVFIKQKSAFKILLPLAMTVGMYMVYRFSPYLTTISNNVAEPSVGHSILTWKAAMFPLMYLGQLTITENVINFFMTSSFNDDYFMSRIMSNLTLLTGAIFLFVVCLLLFKKTISLSLREKFFLTIKKDQLYENRFLIFFLLMILFSSLPFLALPGADGDFKVFPSRYMYYGIAGFAILVPILLKSFYEIKRSSVLRLGALILVIYIFINLLGNWQKQFNLVKVGDLRRNILSSIKMGYPKLPNEVIFYTESDTSYYGLPDEEKIMPFQSGFGQTLLVWYQLDENFPSEFFQNRFLWNITDQDYKDINGRGFGYFRDFDLLARTVKEKDIPLSSVISFRYNSQNGILTDNTEEVRGRLAGYLIDKGEVDPGLFVITPSINSEEVGLMFDRNRDTFWNSEIPYATSQAIDIDLRIQRKIAQVRIDSYNNRDQNEVGYEVSASQDGKDWKTVFFAERYPPNEEGYVDLFFEPKMVRFIRVQQIGFHQYANWVIHELDLYEAID